ncbi:MAG: hypothetical protein HY909_28990 [Deltaproteobacteria bacterium]|nr:hypothetical protein [Deltaproteobacteria bacterium]
MKGPHSALALALLLVAGGASAQATDPDGLHRLGMELRASHRDAEAAAIFQDLWTQTHEPRARIRLGLAQGALGRWLEAEENLRLGLGVANDPWVQSNRARIEADLANVRAHLGRLEVLCDAPGATATLDGRDLGRLPLAEPMWVSVGTVTLEVRAEGRRPYRESLEVLANVLHRERVVLETLAPVVSVTPQPPPPPPPPLPQPRAPPPRAPAPSTGSGRRTLGWAGVASGVTLVGGGGVLLLVGDAFAARWNDDSVCLPPGSYRQDVCDGEREAAETLRPLGGVLLGLGGAVALAGTLLLLLPAAPRERRATTALRCGPGVGGAQLFCEGTF